MRRTMIVYVNADPTQHVLLKLHESDRRAKLSTIKRDIKSQVFARWAPFVGLNDTEWDYCYVENFTQKTGLALPVRASKELV